MWGRHDHKAYKFCSLDDPALGHHLLVVLGLLPPSQGDMCSLVTPVPNVPIPTQAGPKKE